MTGAYGKSKIAKKRTPTVIHRLSTGAPCGRPRMEEKPSAQRLQKAVDKCVERRITLSHFLDLSNRMDDRRVMFAAKTFADFRQRRVCQRLAEIHRDLARHCD